MPLEEMEWKETVDLLQLDKFHNIVEQELARSIDDWRKMTEIDPKSDKMMELLEYQADYFLQRQEQQKSLQKILTADILKFKPPPFAPLVNI